MYQFTEQSLFGQLNEGTTIPTECTGADARVFVSFTCQQDQEQLQEKHQMASKIACLGVLLVLVYLTCLHYFKRHSKLDQVKWDMLTITPGDYTMQMEITEKMYKHYMDTIHCRYPDDPVGVRLKEYIKTNLEMELNKKLREKKNEPKLKEAEGEDDGHCNIEEVKIADIVFAFNNDKLIKLLKQRG